MKDKKTIDFIKKANKIHNNFYDYSKTIFKGVVKKVTITCPIHGDFEQEPRNHLLGHGCTKCVYSKKRLTLDEFIEKSIEKHAGLFYDYSKVEYKNNKTKVCIICPEHGEFWQEPRKHLDGQGCPRCSCFVSTEENDLFLKFKKLKPLQNDRNTLNGYEIDLLFEDKKIGIEYNGLLWHTEQFGGKDKYYHLNKTIECKDKGITLIHLYSDEYINHKDVVLYRLNNLLGIDKKPIKPCIDKCKIREISNKTAKLFLNKYDLNGFIKSDKHIGCYYKNTLISVMSFSLYKGYIELVRLATNIKYKCDADVLYNMIEYYNSIYNNERLTIKTFCDRRWFSNTDNVYKHLGFNFVRYTEPTFDLFSYSNNKRRFNKPLLSINDIVRLKKEYKENIALGNIINEFNYDVIWNCGYIEYELR